MRTLRPTYATLLLALVLAVVSGCSRGDVEWLSGAPPAGTPVWPSPPADPRIAYLGSITSASEGGMTGGILNRVSGLLLGAEPRELVRPAGVLALREGALIVVTDPGIPAIHLVEPFDGRWRVVRESGEVPLLSPIGLAPGPDGEIWIADSGRGAVVAVDPASGNLREVVPPGTLGQPVGLIPFAADSMGVVDSARHCVYWLSTEGRILGREGERGTGPGQFNYPTLAASGPGGALYLSDSLNFRIVRRNDGGVWSQVAGGAGDASGYLSRPKGLAVDRRGNLYVVEGLYGNISIFDARTGAFHLALGQVGSEPGQFRLPVGIHLDEEDRIYVADSANARIQVFRYVGRD